MCSLKPRYSILFCVFYLLWCFSIKKTTTTKKIPQNTKPNTKNPSTPNHNWISNKLCSFTFSNFFSDFSLSWTLTILTSCNPHLPEAAGSVSGGTTLMHAQPLDFSSLHLLLMESVELSSTQRIRAPRCQLHFQAFFSPAFHTQHFYPYVMPLPSCLRILSVYAVWTWIETQCHRITKQENVIKRITFDRMKSKDGDKELIFRLQKNCIIGVSSF